MKSYLTPSLLLSLSMHLLGGVALWMVWSQARPVEVAIHQGGIVLKVAMQSSAAETSREPWHLHAPLVESDHQHPGEELVFHRHDIKPDHSDSHQPVVVSTRSPQHETFVAEPASTASPPAVSLPKQAPRRPNPPPDTPQTLLTDHPPRAQQSIAETTPAEVVSIDAPTTQQNEAGATVDVLPQQLPTNAPPEYPLTARAQRQTGQVMLAVSVNALGRVDQLRVVASSGHPLLDQAALSAVRQWRFKPAEKSGQPVATTVQVPIRFAIRD